MTQDTGKVLEVAVKQGDIHDASKVAEDEGVDVEIPLPRWPLLAVCLCNAAHFYAVCSLFSYAGVMSADLGWAEDRDQAGFAAGFLASANTLGRAPTSSLWGCFAAKFGLKKAITASMVFIALGTCFFGFCTDLTMAVMIRFLFLGGGNGFVALFGLVSMELAGPKRQTDIVGIVFASGTCVQLVGPAVGGWTYGASSHFPAIVPNLLGTGLAVVAIIACWCWLPDELHIEKAPEHKAGRAGLGTALCTWPMPLLIANRSFQGMVCFAFFEVVPLWAISAPELGGLALGEDELGMVLTCSALGTALFMAGIMPVLARRLGLRASSALAAGVAAVTFAVMPWVPGRVSLIGAHMVANGAIGQIGAGYIAFINNSTPPEQRAAVNGVSVTFEALAKGVGPLISAVAFAWTLTLPPSVENSQPAQKKGKLKVLPKSTLVSKPKQVCKVDEGGRLLQEKPLAQPASPRAVPALKEKLPQKPMQKPGKKKAAAELGEDEQLMTSVAGQILAAGPAEVGDAPADAAAVGSANGADHELGKHALPNCVDSSRLEQLAEASN